MPTPPNPVFHPARNAAHYQPTYRLDASAASTINLVALGRRIAGVLEAPVATPHATAVAIVVEAARLDAPYAHRCVPELRAVPVSTCDLHLVNLELLAPNHTLGGILLTVKVTWEA